LAEYFVAAHGQGEREQVVRVLEFFPPQRLARLGVHGGDESERCGLGFAALVEALARAFDLGGADDEVKDAVFDEDLLGVLGVLEDLQDFACGCVECGDRLGQAEGGIDDIIDGREPALEVHGAGSEVPQVVDPGRDLGLPKQLAVECIASDEAPLAGEADRDQRGFVDDEKDAAVVGDADAGAGHFLVAAGPARSGDPLD